MKLLFASIVLVLLTASSALASQRLATGVLPPDTRLQVRWAFVNGTGDFYDQIGFHDPFGYVRWSTHVDLAQTLRIRLSGAWGGPEKLVDRAETLFSIELVPQGGDEEDGGQGTTNAE